MPTSRTRVWSLATAALCVLLLAAAWFLLVSPRRAEAATLTEQRTEVTRGNQTLAARIEQLKQDATTLPQRKAELAVIAQQLTPVTGMSDLVRDLDGAAAQSGLDLVSVTPASPLELAPDGTDAATAAAATGADATATTPTGPRLVAVPVTVVVRGDYFEAALFVKKVQTQLQRLVLVGGVAVAATDPQATVGDAANGVVDVTITGQVYVFLPEGTTAGSGLGTSTGTAGTTAGTASTPAATATATATTGENR